MNKKLSLKKFTTKDNLTINNHYEAKTIYLNHTHSYSSHFSF